MRLSRRIPLIVIAAALVAGAATVALDYVYAAHELRRAAETKLTALLEARRIAVSEYLASIRRDLRLQATSPFVIEAFTAFQVGRGELGAGAGQQLRHLFLAGNPHPPERRHLLDHPNDSSIYSLAHNRFHPRLREVVLQHDYRDLLLLDRIGNVVYSVMKHDDFGADLRSDPLSSSGLARVFRAVTSLPRPDEQIFVDYENYGPSGGQPTGFVATSLLGPGGEPVGVLVLAMPIDRINRVMQVAVGLGETGETVIVGSDRTIRSDSRFASSSTILRQRLDIDAVAGALLGESGLTADQEQRPDGTRVPILAAFAPLDFIDVRWAVIAKADLAEVYAPVIEMRDRAVLNGVVVTCLVALLGFALTRVGVVNPLVAVTGAVRRLTAGDRQLPLPLTDRRDEIGDIARALVLFRDSLNERDRMATERERESKEREVRRRLAEAIETISDGFALLDPDNRFVLVNSRFRDIYASAAECLETGMRYEDFVRRLATVEDAPEARGRLDEYVRERVERLRHPRGSFEYPTADGRWIRATEFRTEDGGAVCLRTDISELKQRERALSDSEERYRLLVDLSPDGIMLHDEDRIRFLNAAGRRLLGLDSAQDLSRIHFGDLVAPEERAAFFERVRLVLSDGREVDFIERNIRTNDGRDVILEIGAAPLRRENRPMAIVVFRDVTDRTLAERRLRESEERFRAIAEGVPTGIVISSLPEGRIIFGNAEASSIFRAPIAHALGRRVDEYYVDPQDRQRVLELVKTDGLVDRLELHFRRPDGSTFWGLMSARRIIHQGAPAMLTTIADISEKREMEERLRDSEQRFRGIAEGVPMPVVITYLDNGRFVYANARSAKVFGVPEGATAGRTVGEFYVDPADRQRLTAAVQQYGSVENFETRLRRADGSEFWALVSAQPITHKGRPALLTAAIDISDRKAAEAALLASERQIRAVVEAHPIPIAIVGVHADQIRYASPAAEALLGFAPGGAVGATVSSLLADSQDRELTVATLLKIGTLDNFETRLRRFDGSEFPSLLSARRIEYDGETCVLVGIMDLTESKRLAREVEAQRERLHQSEKMSALGSLLAGVAHELNNPLSVVVGQATLLQETATDEKVLSRGRKIRDAAERCSKIIRTFLAMARRREPEKQAVRINDVVDSALDLVGYGLRSAGIEVVRDLAADLPEIWADGDQLNQVLTNLFVNAQQAMVDHAGRRRLTVITRPAAGGSMVRIEVADSGPGIAPEVRSRIFEPFFTTKPNGVGTGIGLSLCHSLVESHGGTISATDAPGGGACLVVLLPAGRPALRPAAPETPAPAAAGDRRRILIVDDEVEIAQTLAEILERAGHHAAIAADGRQALARLEQERFDLVISDLRMPGLDGPGLYRELLGRQPELARRMIVITGDALAANANDFLKETGLPCLDKPFDSAQVARAVVEALRPFGPA